MDDYSIMWPQSSPCRSHVHRSHTQSYTRRHIQSHITDGKETFGQKEAVCAPAETKIWKNVQSFLDRSECACTQMKRFAGNTHLFLWRETWPLFNISLSLSPVLSTQRNSERQKNMSCKREPIVPWREQMEPPTNHWALHSPAFLKKHRHKQQHWLCSPIKRLCFYIHSGILTKMWRCPCAILQAEIRLCVTNARWARHGNPQTELVHTPPRYRLLNASPSGRSQSVELTIPSWACVPAGELGERSLRISKLWLYVNMYEG